MTNTTTTKFCNECQRYVNHTEVNSGSADNEEYSPEYECDIGLHKGYTVFRCLGCNEHFIECWKWFSEHNREDIIKTRYPNEKYLEEPEWMTKLPIEILKLLKEIYIAIQDKCLTLACTGIRTVLDRVFTDKVGAYYTSDDSLNAMIQSGYITAKQKELLEIVFDIGSASAHRSLSPILKF